MNIELKSRIAKELVKIAAELSGVEEFDAIDAMTVSQLIDYLKKHKSRYTVLPPATRINKFKDRVDMSKPLRSMRVKELLQMVAKFGVDIDEEKE
jgi:hypothetical protein